MRRLAALVLIVIAATAHAAGAPKRITVVAQPALRRAETPPPRPAPTISAPSSATWAQSGVDGAACRTGCAQTRYFCEADPNADDCGSAWSQCVATCGAPALNSASAAAAGN